MIKNLLFDLGGVIMNIRRADCVEAFRKLGMAEADSYLGEYSQSGPFKGIENGDYTPAQFHDAVRAIIGSPVTDEAIDEAFCRFLLGIPAERLRALEKLHRNYRIYMLSNTNPIMWHRAILPYFTADGHSLTYYFDGVLRSYEAGCMKPDPEIFRQAEERFGIRPGETIFLDDSLHNTEVAASLGFHTIHVAPGQEFLPLVKQDVK